MSTYEIITLIIAFGMFLLEAFGLWQSHRHPRSRKYPRRIPK
jgi:hypothetical protein